MLVLLPGIVKYMVRSFDRGYEILNRNLECWVLNNWEFNISSTTDKNYLVDSESEELAKCSAA